MKDIPTKLRKKNRSNVSRHKSSQRNEDELPKILPPKRRRLIKQANTAPTGTGMERIMQEFPRHNWLENKYLPEETSNDGNQTENSSSNQYQYELLHEQEEDTPISEIQPFSEERNRKEDVPNSSIIINTPERKESQINNITVDTDLNKSDVSTPTLPQDIVCYSTDNTERFPDKITEEHSSAAAYGASAVVDNKDSVEGETMKIQWKAFTNQQTSSESEPVQTNGTLCDNKGNTASSPSKISSIALDSDVGTVISITEDKNKDIHRATSQKHRDILPPVPKLIHATTLKSMTANKETLSPDEATYPQVTEQLHREVVNECKENTPESLEISSNDQCGIITKNEQTEESLLQSFAHKNNENNETSALSAMNEVKLCETSPRCAISSRSSPSTHAPLVSSKNASLHAVSNVKQEMEVINLSKSDAYRVPKKSFQIPMQSPIEEAKMMNSPARSNTNHVGRNEIDDSESFEKQAVSTSNDKHITYEKQNLEYAHASSQRDSPRIPLKAAIMKSYQPEVAMNKMTNCHVVPVVMPLQSSSPVQKDIRRPMVDQKQLDEALRYEKALQEYKTIEKMTQIKEKERNDLLLLKEKKYRELKTLQANVPIHPTVNTSVRLKPPINALVPPPAHQNKKENTLEILEKMAKDSHLVQPGIKNVANSFKSRQIPVLDPPENINMSSNSSCHSRSQTEMQNKPVHWTYIPTVDDVPSHNSAQSIVQTSRSSSAPAMYNNNKSPFSQYKTQINPTPQQNGNVVHEPNEFTLKGIKRLHSDEFVELRLNNVCAQEEQKIQEALNQAMVVKKQRMNAANSANSVRYEHINNNNHTNYAPANSQVSHQQFRKISAGISQYQQGHQNQNTIANGIRPDGALTKDLLIKGTPMANQIYDAQYVQRFPLNQTNIIRPSNTMPRQCRPQTVRLLGAAAQPRCTVPNNTIRAYQGFRVPLQTSLHPDHTGPRHMLRTTREQPCHNAIAQQNIAPSSVGYKYQYPVTTYPQATAYRPQPVTENKSLMSPHQRHSAHPCVQNLPSIAPQSTTIHPQHSTPMHMATSSTHNTTAHRLPVVHINSNNTVKKEDISVETHVTRMNGNCIICKKFALYLCSNCQQFWYCSPDCQLKHWVSHQNDCNAAISSQR